MFAIESRLRPCIPKLEGGRPRKCGGCRDELLDELAACSFLDVIEKYRESVMPRSETMVYEARINQIGPRKKECDRRGLALVLVPRLVSNAC